MVCATTKSIAAIYGVIISSFKGVCPSYFKTLVSLGFDVTWAQQQWF
jgi:hypothetical protein